MVLTNLAGKKPDNIDPWINREFDTNRGPKDCLPKLAKEMDEYLNTYSVTWDDVVGVGLGIPGTLNHDLQRLVKPPRMPGWDGVEIPKRLKRLLPKGKTQLPIYLDNDANMGALGESRYGAGHNIMNLVYVKVGDGIGAGLILGGQLYRGGGIAGELGHMVIEGGDLECPGCGNCCLEMLAARSAILREVGYDDKPGSFHEMVAQARSGNEIYRAALEHAARRIGKALANLIDLVHPEVILLGGGVMLAAHDLLLPSIRDCALKACVPAAAKTDIQMGNLHENAIVRGAVATVIEAAFGTQTILEAAFGTTNVAGLGLVATR
jgi:predicted NBD/HSP70 family sugar kinase